MSNPGPFYFAWVDASDSTFVEGTHARVDEDIFDFTIKHDEGQFATLDLTIKNPRIGLLNAGRKLWAWFAYKDSTGHVRPLFFGVLVGVPTDMFAELVQLKFNARPEDFIDRKQTVAETLKTRPYYDPVWLDDTHRDDPDAILEGWSKLYHIDRITHAVTVSDILEGEDGVVDFDQTQGIYESVRMELGEAPLSVVQVQAGVQWTQRAIGILPSPINVNVNSYTGGSFKGDWPKPGTELGGGWKCEASIAIDALGTEHAKSSSNSSNWQSKDKESGDCSTESMSISISGCNNGGIGVDGHVEEQVGICDPDGFNQDGSQGVNIPAKINISGTIALAWALNCSMYLRYDAKRDFTEQVTIDVQANVQDTVVSPLLDQNTEVMKVSGANVGLPLVNIDAWSNFEGVHVGIATIILPNDRSRVGGTSYQVCVVAGTAGSIEPTFSDIPGNITIDGTVHWASLGDQAPTSQPAWTDSTPVPAGEIVLYEPKVFSAAAGSFETTGQSCFLLCIVGGTTKSDWVDIAYFPPQTALPAITAYIPGPGQASPYNAPIFPAGTQLMDGSVTWMSLGTAPPYLGIPIGGTTENVTARSYFTTDRGRWSVEYLICKARARLRLRSRCVRVQFDAPFEDCLDLSCRKNATLLDGRIPGGACTGKITGYELQGGKDGKLIGHITLGVSVGFANSVPDVTGTPEYTPATGYMQAGYQLYDGGQYSIAEEDIAYTPPVFKAFDDGLAFPLQFFPGIVKMTTPSQISAVEAALASRGSSFVSAAGFPSSGGSLLPGSSASAYLADINPREYALEVDPVMCEIIIRPVTNGPFNGAITVECTMLELPQGINLSADSS